MKCMYCKLSELAFFDTQMKAKESVTCPQCNSYYRFLEEKNGRFVFHAYPASEYKKYYQNEKLYLNVPK